MIPVRLTIRNFLSYGEPEPLDFTGFEVACLSGPNGVGKSSLVVDAVTYALFGAARGCEDRKNTERLIRDGADQMSVELVFELDGNTYQVVRGRSRSGKGEVRLSLRMPDGWTNLAGDTATETDRRIGEVLRLDYRTFTTSAFFLQGRADDFLARMKPEERKEVFARLLDLGTYERLEAAARERARDAARRRTEIAAQLERAAAEAQDPSALEAELASARAEAAAAATELEGRRRRAKEAAAAVATLEATQTRLEGEERALSEAEERAAADRAAVEAPAAELAEIDELLERADEVRAATDELRRLRDEDEAMRAAEREASDLRAHLSAAEAALHAERVAIERRIAETKKAATALRREIAGLATSERRLASLDALVSPTDDLERELDRVAAELKAQREAHTTAERDLSATRARLEEVDEKLRLLSSDEGTCPVCGTELDRTHRTQISRELGAKKTEMVAASKMVAGTRDMAAKEMRRLEEETTRLEAARKEHAAIAAERAAVGARLERLPQAREDLDRLDEALRADADALGAGTFAAAARDEIDGLKARLAEVYDAEAHERIRTRITELSFAEAMSGRLTEAAERRQHIAAALTEARSRADRSAALAGERAKAIAVLAEEVRALPAARRGLEEAEAAAAAATSASGERERVVTQLEERLDAARRAADEVADLRRREAAAAASRRHHEMLATAFGRGGIPDRIIENALPELREEANDVLDRLSDHEMGLQFQMQRETKSGKVRETFDVLVHHDGGVRDFQMFSGGEAFRIAFAVRLALSKLLVRRAGARLETLVIDEGFGTQDPEGRERLVEAINLARTEFAKVIVISHIDDLKDVFGTQIRVWKDEGAGSRLEIAGG